MTFKLKQFSIMTMLLSTIVATNMYSKTVVFSGTTNRILPMIKEVGNALDENRWSIGELISSTTTISNPGVFILADDIEVNSGIVIDADNVLLDLNGHMVYDNSGTTTAITINNGHKNIFIRNGSINGKADTSTASGILIKPNASLVQIEDVRILECYTGIKLGGVTTETVTECKITNCMLVTNTKGIVVNYATKNIFLNCAAYNCAEAGFELNNSELNLFEECQAIQIKNGNPNKKAIGFASTDGCGNIFKECIVNGVYKSSSNFGYDAIGFLFKDNETRSKIYNSIVNRSLCSGDGTSYGIQLDFTLNDDALSQALYTGNLALNEVFIVDWSPETKFIALGGADNTVRIATFDGSTLTQIDSKTPNGSDINALAWSPDGTYLAVGTDKDGTGDEEFFVYTFDSSPLDPTSITTLEDSKHISDHVHSVAWAPNSRFIALGVDVTAYDYEIQVWGFDGSALSTSALYTIERTSDVKAVSYSPDGKYLAAVHGTQLEIFSFDPTNNLMLTSVDVETAYGGTLKSVDWSPLTCGSRYYVAVGGTRSSKTVEVFSFENETLTSLETADHGASIEEIRWAPNGKYLLTVGGAEQGDEIRIYSFDASATAGSRLTSEATGNHVGGTAYSADWESGGRYIVVVGSNVDEDVTLFETSTVPRRCIIESNEIADSQIGIEGSSGSNLITRNIGYYNTVCFSNGVFNTFIEGLNENPTNIDNICLPPFYYSIFRPDDTGGCNGGEEEEEECQWW